MLYFQLNISPVRPYFWVGLLFPMQPGAEDSYLPCFIRSCHGWNHGNKVTWAISLLILLLELSYFTRVRCRHVGQTGRRTDDVLYIPWAGRVTKKILTSRKIRRRQSYGRKILWNGYKLNC